MNLKSIADSTIDPSERRDLFLHGSGYDIGNIMEATMRVYRQHNHQVKHFAPYLQGNTLKETCRNIWKFIRNHIAYKKDPRGEQWLRRPSRLWEDKEGDCKSFSVFTASVLHQLGINGVFRFVSYDPKNDTPVHVYVVVPDGKKEIVIDCVPEIKFFGQEARYITKRDYSMDRLMELAGIDQQPQITSDQMLIISLMEALVNERTAEARANGGWILEARDKQYQQAFAALQKQLRSLSISGVEVSGIEELASYTGIPGASTFASMLTSILGNKPNPNDWKGWTPGDVKQWVANDGDSVSNEAINIISYINAHGLKDIIDSDAFGRNRVTIAQIANKLQRGNFPQQAATLLNSPAATNNSTGVRPITNTVNDINAGSTNATGNNNTLLLVAGVGVAAYFLLKK